MSYFLNNPDYTLRWPPHILREELERILRRATQFGPDQSWRSEVDTLLRQAFTSSVPRQDYERVRNSASPMYDDAEEPF